MNTSKCMKLLFFFFFPLTVFSQTHNSELQKLFEDFQSASIAKDIDKTIVSKQKRDRESRVYELIQSGQLTTGRDHYYSAIILHNGSDTIASAMAITLMRKAIELDSTTNNWLLAAAIDKDLMKRKKPQIYGTQFVRNNEKTKWKRYDIDTTQITDEERKYYHVETLAEQRTHERNMNLRRVSDFYSKSNSIKKTIKFIKREHKKGLKSNYDTSEKGLESFSYTLMNTKRENDALEIFTLNTKLYPNGYNTYDSLGRCLLLLGKKEEGIKAYKKSLELNPKNEHAKKIINDEK